MVINIKTLTEILSRKYSKIKEIVEKNFQKFKKLLKHYMQNQ